MFSYCDLTAELDLQEISCDSNNLYPELCNNSTYYEEKPLYNEICEPRLERCKSIKTKQPSPPVEIRQESTLSIDLPPISWHNYDSIPKILNVTNTGRTILINGQWAKSRPYITGGPLNGNYLFSQIHFHSPSEHEINGKRYPLEMHVVHYKTSYLTQERAMEEKDGTVVIVYLFQVLNSNESFLSSIMDSIHLIEGINDRTEFTNIALTQILQPVFSNYYIYWGSISTSKNSYLLQWIISCSNLYVTQKEMDKLIKILCSNESLIENQVSQMKIINNIIYHVEGYDMRLNEVDCSDCSNVMPKCYCRYHCQNCKICVIHKEEYLQFHITKPISSSSKKLHKSKTELQTSSCEKTSKAISKSSLCDTTKEREKNVETISTSSCSPANSQSSICEDEKKTQNKKNVCKVPSWSGTTKASNCNDGDESKSTNFIEPETCSKYPSTEKNLKTNVSFEIKNVKKKDEKTKSKKVQNSETSSCDTLKSSSKASVKNPKAQNKKKKTKNTSEGKSIDSSSKSSQNNKKEKQKSKQKKTNKCSESSVDGSKNSEGVKRKKENEGSKNPENCDVQVELQCMPVLVSTNKPEEKLIEIKMNSVNENKKEEIMKKSAKKIEEFPAVCEKVLAPPEDVKTEKKAICSELDDVKTIFEKKRDLNNAEPNGKDYTINFLLAPNTLQNKCSPMTSESECLEMAKNINLNCSTPVNESTNKVPKLEVSSIKSQEQSRDISFEMEHLFRTERKGDSSTCVTQEYNVAVICNHNIIQEFKGTFHPNELDLGIYEKLHLVPKYPEPENINVRLDNCFVKKETLDQLYIRVKFLLNKDNISDIASKAENTLEEEIKLPDLELLDIKNNQLDCVEEEKHHRDNEAGNQINCNQLYLNSKVLEKEEYKVELLKKPDSDPKLKSKNIPSDLQHSSKLKEEEEKRDNNLIEKSDKTIKDLFYKRKKVYFSCEKVEKDENSGKKVFVGSFRTKKELKALSKDKKLAPGTDGPSLAEKSMKTVRDKSRSSSEKSFEELGKTEKSKAQQKYKSGPPAKYSESDKSDESKNLITLHKPKPKNSQVNYSINKCKNIEFHDGKIITQSEISSLADKNKSKKPDVDPSSGRSQRLSSNKSQSPLKILPTEKENLPKTEVILTEHLKNVKKNVKKKEKEYIPCLNYYC